MEMKLIELLFSAQFIYALLGILVWSLTYLIKAPIKRATEKIKDEKKRKIANKWVLAIPFILALIFESIYYWYKFKVWFVDMEEILSKSFFIALFAITWYNVFEGLKGKKSEYEITDEGFALYSLIQVYAKDRTKVLLLLNQCKNNLLGGVYSISDTVKGFLPENVPPDVFNTIVKTIEVYFKKPIDKKGDLLP